jgi:hypothetical protein
MPATLPSTTRSPRIADGCGKVAPMLAALVHLLATDDAATEGKKVITGMLIVGLIFISVIALGETVEWLRHRRR